VRLQRRAVREYGFGVANAMPELFSAVSVQSHERLTKSRAAAIPNAVSPIEMYIERRYRGAKVRR